MWPSDWGRKQKSQQKHASRSAQRQKTQEIQMFRDQVNNTFLSVTSAAKLAQRKGVDEEKVNQVTDFAIISLDMFAVNCVEFRKENNKEALEIAKKTIYDRWGELQKSDAATFAMTTMHRDFMIAQLNTSKCLTFKSYRDTNTKDVAVNSQTMNRSFARMIGSKCTFNKTQQSNLEEKRNDELAEQHQDELDEFKKYDRLKTDSEQSKYQRPSASAFYFTKSGQNGQFGANSQGQQEADNELVPEQDAYAQIRQMHPYRNVVLKFSRKVSLPGIDIHEPYPCLLEYDELSKTAKLGKVKVRPAYPHHTTTIWVPPQLLELDVERIAECEQRHMEKYGKLGAEKESKYRSVMQQQQELESAIHGDHDDHGKQPMEEDEASDPDDVGLQ